MKRDAELDAGELSVAVQIGEIPYVAQKRPRKARLREKPHGVLAFEKAIGIQRLVAIKFFVARDHVRVQLPRIGHGYAVGVGTVLRPRLGSRWSARVQLRVIFKNAAVKLKRR